MYLKILKKLAEFAAISLLVVNAQAASAVSVEMDSQVEPISQTPKLALDKRVYDLAVLFDNVINVNKKASREVLQAAISKQAEEKGIPVSFANGKGSDAKLFTVWSALKLGDYTVSTGKRFGLSDEYWYVAVERYLGKDIAYGAEGTEEGAKQLMAELTKR